jgi:hypothetical protein
VAVIAYSELEDRADAIVARLSPAQQRLLAVHAMTVVLADRHSLADQTHRERAYEVLRSLAPSLTVAIRRLTKTGRYGRAEPLRG